MLFSFPSSTFSLIVVSLLCVVNKAVSHIRSIKMSVFWPGKAVEVKNYIQMCDTRNNRPFPNSQGKELLLQHDRPVDRPLDQLAAELFLLSSGKHNFLLTTDYWSNY